MRLYVQTVEARRGAFVSGRTRGRGEGRAFKAVASNLASSSTVPMENVNFIVVADDPPVTIPGMAEVRFLRFWRVGAPARFPRHQINYENALERATDQFVPVIPHDKVR